MGGRKHRFTKAEIDEAIINALSSQKRKGGGWASAAFGAAGKAGRAAVETVAQKVAREAAEALARNAAEAVARAAPEATQAASKATAKAAADATATAAAKNAAEAAAATGSKGLAGRVNDLVTKIAANPYIQVASIGASVAMPVYDELKSQEKARQVEADKKAAAAEYEKEKAALLAKNASDKLINDTKIAENTKKNDDILKKANDAYDAQLKYYADATAALNAAKAAEVERARLEREQMLALLAGATNGTASGATNPPAGGFTDAEIQAAISAAIAGNAAVGNPTVSPPPNQVGGPPSGNVVTSPPVVVVPPPITKKKKGGSKYIDTVEGPIITCWPNFYPQTTDPPKITDLAPPMQESLQQQIQNSMQLNNQLLNKRRNVVSPAINATVLPIRPPPKNPTKPPARKGNKLMGGGFTKAEINKAILAAIKNQRMF